MSGQVLINFGLNPSLYSVEPFGSGLIHHTYLLKSQGVSEYILQEVNTDVFRRPGDIAFNLRITGSYLRENHPDYYFPLPLNTVSGEPYAEENGRIYRLTPFVRDSHAINSCESVDEAFEAARQFGKFTALLNGVDTGLLKYTIPGFHDLTLRWNQFLEALQSGNQSRIDQTREQIIFLRGQENLVNQFESIRNDSRFKLRVIHHDTKINNVLFDRQNKGICVIDLDTVMPGYFISDLGDMMRTYLSPADEEENDFNKITIRTDFFEAIVKGYLQDMQFELNSTEKDAFIYAGEFMIFMQALRFMTDYINDDRYYGSRYEGHNLFRAMNQINLLQKFRSKQPLFKKMINQLLVFSF